MISLEKHMACYTNLQVQTIYIFLYVSLYTYVTLIPLQVLYCLGFKALFPVGLLMIHSTIRLFLLRHHNN